ncbi:putative WD repeat-containing protein C2A9.03 [Sesamum angolense]|uniref:WD repeat-containing protein C2A9.03 n=1 Tax=Sesamum angolense TaxID=2727404 RepID=A0AAE1W6R9_9LAMI|nr:putative WD repeat-containing protein C2A9.03 [Sesamum angolense]
MEQFQNQELEYVVDDYYDVTDFEDDDVTPRSGSSSFDDDDSMDSDFEDDFELSKSKTDTSALEVRNGKDIQVCYVRSLIVMCLISLGSKIFVCSLYPKLSMLEKSLEHFSGLECKEVEKGQSFNTRLVKSTIVHFQLRNLLWATSKHDVYLMQNYSVMHWSSLLRRGKEVLNVAKPITPTLKYPGCLAQPLSRVQISTMTVKDNLMVAGGFQGELILYRPTWGCVLHEDKFSILLGSGATRVMTANNDAQVRVMDAVNFTCLNRFTFPWSVNNTSVSPDGKLLAVLGDSPECLIADAQSGKVIGNLKGHLDYSFASAWHPDGRILATGNQDTTCRLWDVRNLSESIAVLKGRMGAIRAVKFTSDGRYMAMAEPADFVHIFDTQSDYLKGQEIDLFGEIAGISFSPDTEALFVGVADRTYGSLLEFNRKRYDHYLDCIV